MPARQWLLAIGALALALAITPWLVVGARHSAAPAKLAPFVTTPQDVVETIFKFHQAGVRHLILDFVGPYEERDQQIERFAAEAMPLLAGLRKG